MLTKLAAYFGVTVDDLLADNEKPAPTNGDGLTEQERLVLEAYRNDHDARARMDFEVSRYMEKAASSK